MKNPLLSEKTAKDKAKDFPNEPDKINMDENHPAHRQHGHFAKDRVSQQLAGPRMTIDPNTDPMFVNANQAVADPDATLLEQKVTFIDDKDYVEKTCIETRDEEFEVINTASIDPYYKHFEVWQFYNHCPNHRGWGKNIAQGCQTWSRPELMHPARNPDADYEETHGMNWKGEQHPDLERLQAAGKCRLKKEMSREEGRASRMIPVEFYKKEETREDWKIAVIDEPRQGRSRLKRPEDFGVESFVKTQVFICSYHAPGNTCKALRDQGGTELTSTCRQLMGSVCVKWDKVYIVPKVGAVKKMTRTKGNTHQKAFNADGTMNDKTYTDNKEAPEALAKLQAIRDIGAALPKIDTSDPNSLAIFKGQDLRCVTQGGAWSRHGCPGQKGKKEPDEQKLELLDRQGKCIRVGSYDEKDKNIGTMIGQKRTVTSYCCFETILSKVLHQGAINQGVKSLGEPKSPNCGPLTLGQIQAIDWDRVDFGPFVADMMSRVNLNSGHVAQKSANAVQAHLSNQMEGAKRAHIYGGGNR